MDNQEIISRIQEIMSRIETLESTLSLVVETIKCDPVTDRVLDDLNNQIERIDSNYMNICCNDHNRIKELEERIGETSAISDLKKIMMELQEDIWESVESNTLSVNALKQEVRMMGRELDRLK